MAAMTNTACLHASHPINEYHGGKFKTVDIPPLKVPTNYWEKAFDWSNNGNDISFGGDTDGQSETNCSAQCELTFSRYSALRKTILRKRSIDQERLLYKVDKATSIGLTSVPGDGLNQVQVDRHYYLLGVQGPKKLFIKDIQMACIQSDYVIQIILSSKSHQNRLTDSTALGWIERTDQPRARQNIIKYTMGPSLESIGHGQLDETGAQALIGTRIFLCVSIINMTLLLSKLIV